MLQIYVTSLSYSFGTIACGCLLSSVKFYLPNEQMLVKNICLICLQQYFVSSLCSSFFFLFSLFLFFLSLSLIFLLKSCTPPYDIKNFWKAMNFPFWINLSISILSKKFVSFSHNSSEYNQLYIERALHHENIFLVCLVRRLN